MYSCFTLIEIYLFVYIFIYSKYFVSIKHYVFFSMSLKKNDLYLFVILLYKNVTQMVLTLYLKHQI